MSLIQPVLGVLPQLVLQLLRTLMLGSHFPYAPTQFETDTLPLSTYDFIVVGAGCAGSVVTSRLSETGASVLVLEAGGSAPLESAVPALISLVFGGEADWRLKGKPQKNAQLGYRNNSAYLLSGKAMGGSTTTNGMVYLRGNKGNYDHWAQTHGNVGWDYDSVLPYFRKSEIFRGYEMPGSSGYRGRSGPVSVESRKVHTKIPAAFLKAGQELGYDIVDGSGPNHIGVSPFYSTTKNGVRASASENYLRPVRHRKNLHITPRATVTKILFNKSKRAVGVEYVFKEKKRMVRARREVIISAGTLHTPKLLMLSGVGPANSLRKLGIPVVADLAGVGENLHDHANLYLNWEVKKGTSTSTTDLLNPANLIEYLKSQTGFFAEPSGLEANGFFKLGDDGGDPTRSDVQLSVSSISFAADLGVFTVPAFDMKRETYNELYGGYFGRETLTINPCLLRPKSRGSVTLRSNDPNDEQIVDINYFDHPDDMKLMIRGIKMAIRMASTKAMEQELEPRMSSKLSACDHLEYGTDAYWECYARHTITTLWHYAGTAKMSSDADPLGVVTPRLRVRKVSGLRVIDASIMPEVVSSNSQAATYMIGEKGADMIKEDWGYPTDSNY